jgi:SAM-dependent methyltransferase
VIGPSAYDFGVQREPIAQAWAAIVLGSDARLLYRAIAQLRELPPGGSVLDAPCGGGVAFRGLDPAARVRYVAADISPVMLKRARREAARRGLDQVDVLAGDMEALEFEDASFDACVSFNGLHCLSRPSVAVAELARVLRPGAILRGSCVVRGAGKRQDVAIAVYRRAGVFGEVGTADDVRSWLVDAGFADVELAPSGAIAYLTARASPTRRAARRSSPAALRRMPRVRPYAVSASQPRQQA